MSYVSINVDVDVDVDDAIANLSETEVTALFKRHLPKQGVTVPIGAGDGDASRIHTIIERAYLAAQKMPDMPRELADLFWHVHGRAI